MPHKTQEEVRGVHANPVLLSFFNDTIGRDVLLETRDGRKYEGIFAGCSQDFDVGLRLAHELRSDDVNQLLPLKANVIEKLAFGPADVLCMSVLMHDEKRIKGFATDQEYKTTARNGVLEDCLELSNEFEVWEADGNDDEELENSVDMKKLEGGLRMAGTGTEGSTGGGWSVDDMFNANNALGVKSTFDDNLSQYTTANIEGDGEARLRAERIAQEIEMNPASRARARMENDDEERDLNKETPEFQVHSHRRNQNAGGRSNYSGNLRGAGLQSGGGSNRGGGHPMPGRRSDGSGSGQRQGRGGIHSGGGSAANVGSNATSRSFTNSSLSSSSHSMKGGSGGGSPSQYQPQSATGGSSSAQGNRFQPPPERPSAQSVHNEFGQWSEMRTGGAITVGGVSNQKMNNARRSDASVLQQSNTNQRDTNNKLYDANHRNNTANQHTSHSSVNRTSGISSGSQATMNKGSSAQLGGSTGGAVKGGGQTERMKGLRDFHQNFNNTYHSNAQSHATTNSNTNNNNEEQQKSLSSPSNVAISSTAVTTGTVTSAKTMNAWNKGPPASIRSSGNQSQSQPPSAGITSHPALSTGAANQTLKSSQSSDQIKNATQQAINNQPSASSQPTTPQSSVSSLTTTKVITTDRSSNRSVPIDSSHIQHKPASQPGVTSASIPPVAGTSQKSTVATSVSGSGSASARGATPSRTTPSTSPVQTSASATVAVSSQASVLSGAASSGSTGAPSATGSSQSSQQQHSNAGTPTPTVLSGTASSSSIAPIDPTPTVTTTSPGGTPALSCTTATSSTTAANSVQPSVTVTAGASGSVSTSTSVTSVSATSGSTAKKFEFNPDAQPFTPRSIATAQGVTMAGSGVGVSQGLVGGGGLGMQTIQGLQAIPGGGIGVMQGVGVMHAGSALAQQQVQAQAQAVSLQQQQQQQAALSASLAAAQQPLLAGVTPHNNATAVHAAGVAAHNATAISLNGAPQAIPIAQSIQPGQLVAHAAPPQMFPYAAGAGVYGTAVPVYYGSAQPMMQAGTAQIAPGVNVTMSGAPNIGGGSILAAGQGGATPRGVAQLGGISSTSAGSQQPNGGGRRGQQQSQAQNQAATQTLQQQQAQQAQQQLIQSGGGVYVPANQMAAAAAAAGYPQQMIHAAQYQVPFYTTPYQQMSLASANVPPPTVPPPTSSSVAVAGAPPQSFQVVQTQTPHQQAIYSRQLYQGAQPLNYMVATATGPRYAQQPHQTVDYIGGTFQQCSQQPSSAGSSNGNSSNGHNSQPATPGPQPIASPAQVAAYPVSGTPQSPHSFVVPVPNAPPHHPQHMYVHPATAAQFPIFSAAQTGGSYVVYTGAGGHQSMMQMHPHPSALQTNPQMNPAAHSQNQGGHHGHPQINNGGMDQSQQQSHSQMNSSGGATAPQSYAITTEQQHQLQQFVHPQQSAAIFQQQQAAVAAASLVRQNSLNNAAAQQNASYQSSHPNGGNN